MARIVNPTGHVYSHRASLAPRPAGIEGLRVGLLDNNKPGAKALLLSIGEGLKERGAAETVYRRKSHPAGPSPYVGEIAERVDIAVSAVGD